MCELKKFCGIIPAFYACYDDHGEINVEGVKKLVRYFIDKGVAGIYVNGSSGECIYQTVDERKKILETVMEEASGRIVVISHVACNNIKDSMTLAKHAESLGVDAIASIPPIYFRLPEDSIAEYWNQISSAAPNTNFIIYNIPQLAGTTLTVPLFRKMRENPRVIGVKNSSIPTQDIQIFKSEGGNDCVIFNGVDEQYIAGKVMGGDGGIGGTYGVMPELFLKMDNLLEQGNITDAKKIQYFVNRIIEKLCSGQGSMYALIKEVLRVNEGIDIGDVRSPLPSMTKTDFKISMEAADMIKEARELFIK